MNTKGKTQLLIAAGIVIGIVIGSGIATQLLGPDSASNTSADSRGEPLYWVAPMDPSYRRDEPGKSPMGMDLIPVYEAGASEPGSVLISPDVINNIGVRTAAVKTGQLESRVNTVGYVRYDEDQLVNVEPRVEGWVESLTVKADGDPVTAGEPLYTLYSPTLVNAQEELLLALRRGNQALIDAATERLRALRVPSDFIEALRESRELRQSITVNAPQSGVISGLQAREGSHVRPGSAMMSIAVLDQVWVVGEIFERQLPLIDVGDSVVMHLDYLPGRRWQGQVDYVYPSIDNQTRTARIRIRLPNEDRALKPGMFAQLSISGREGREALLIPKHALIRTGDGNRVVLARGEGRFKSVSVTVGIVGDRQVEIISGLEEGDHIVTSAQFLIDSESSKTSDFRRMDHDHDDADQPQRVLVAATVVNLMPEHRMVTVTHEAIPEWGWPIMTMDFTISEAVDLNALREGADVHVEIARLADGQYQLSAVHGNEHGQQQQQDDASHEEQH
ncbi:MAG: efflux RND transporter periplasmic adaptor subunit [Cellvibrionaceae bacterium]